MDVKLLKTRSIQLAKLATGKTISFQEAFHDLFYFIHEEDYKEKK